MSHTTTLIAGIPASNMNLLHRTRFPVADPAAYITFSSEHARRPVFIVRDIEVARARAALPHADVLTPEEASHDASSLPADRELATAIAVADCLASHRITQVVSDRTLSLCFLDAIASQGIEVVLDPDLGLRERRAKTQYEIDAIRTAQATTEQAVELICTTIARAEAKSSGVLHFDGDELTSERLAAEAQRFLIERGYQPGPIIVACGQHAGDCHKRGSGSIYTEHSVIVDIFPTSITTHYVGDCTRTVVHGEAPPRIVEMHQAVLRAKSAATNEVCATTTSGAVHAATVASLKADGFENRLPDPDQPYTATMPHGTGHGVGLEVHELPLVDHNGLPFVECDVITIEPGLYQPDIGGVRVEDIVVVQADGCESLNALQEGLDWSV